MALSSKGEPMKKTFSWWFSILFATIVGLAVARIATSSAQVKPASTPEELFRVIAAQDAALFDSYNRCDLEKFGSFFTDDVEFYHDRGGLTLGRQKLTESVKNNICGKVTRELVPGSLEVYPMENYGALEIGVHLFHHPNDPKAPDGEG